VTLATEGEVQTLAQLGVTEPIDWFPNGVDLDYFQPGTEPHDPDLISFVGRMDYFPNEQCMVDFCADVWPRLKHARPALRLKIIGAAPTARVQALGRLDGVTVTGAVPDVRPHVRGSALTIAPLKIARGTQNKILEAMAMGVPVIASGVAARGVDAVVGEHLLQADTPDQLYDTIIGLLDRPNQRARLAAAARQRVGSHHDWPRAMRRLDAIIGRCMAVPRPGAALAAA
jgi:glycosyltransferase involved in cell wall biosynthesis